MALRISSKTDARRGLNDPRWLLAERIAGSRSIGRSPLLSEFLLYICHRHLRDQPSELTEQRIGVHVFGRSEGYNSNDDNIVRNYARTLRRRVDEYFATEGKHEDLKLEIPRGAYIPVFYSRPTEKPLPREQIFTPTAPAPVFEDPSPGNDQGQFPIEQVPGQSPQSSTQTAVDSSQRRPRLWYHLLALGVILVAAIAVSFSVYGLPHSPQLGSSRDLLWGQLFRKDRDTFIVPADSGLVIMQGLTRRAVPLGDYVSGSYRADMPLVADLSADDVKELGTRRYTSIVDLNLVSRLSRLKEMVPERMLIRYARDLRMDDLRSSNAILLGSTDSNPWVGLFEQQLNFRFSFDPKSDAAPVIINQHPLPGEQALYATHQIGSWHGTYGRIAYLPNLEGTGHVLLIGGLNMAGTQAAGDFVLNGVQIQTVFDHARGPDGNLRPFEILIETSNVAANASSPRVISERIAPAR